MHQLINILIKIALTFVVIFIAGIFSTIINGPVNGSKPMPFYLSLMTLGGIFLVWRANYIKAANSKSDNDEL